MSTFPRTMVGGVSMPRLIVGSNWFLGYSHTSAAKDRLITELFDTPRKIADVVEVFARAGCNAFMSRPTPFIAEALRDVEQRVGTKMLWVCTPGFAEWEDPTTWGPSVEETVQLGGAFCFPHQYITDARLDRVNRALQPDLLACLREVREAGLLPGLSTHTPESIICADACGADVVSYVQPYNAAGFLCQAETDWTAKVIHQAKHPVICIKPLAAGRLLPPTGLAFVWNTIRDCDMVCIGTMSRYEAEEVIELSLACLEGRDADVDLQFTRSKQALQP
jgi:hypothetical protein